MDFHGQKLSEQLSFYVVLFAAVISFVVGYSCGSFALMLQVMHSHLGSSDVCVSGLHLSCFLFCRSLEEALLWPPLLAYLITPGITDIRRSGCLLRETGKSQNLRVESGSEETVNHCCKV